MSDMGGDGITSAEGRLLAVQMGALREDLRELKGTMLGMARSLEQLVRIEEQQKDIRSAINRAFDEIKFDREKLDKFDRRLGSVEREIPGLRESRRWIILAILGVLGIVGGAIIWQVLPHIAR